MAREIFIDGYDFSDIVVSIPVQDKTTPQWGQVSDQILNEVVKIQVPKFVESFFNNGRNINSILVQIYESGLLEFDGVISEIDYTLNSLDITCKSFSTVLFNTTLNEDETDYIIENETPANILKEVLRLATVKIQEYYPSTSFELDNFTFEKTNDIQTQQQFYFNVFARKTNFAELLNKIMEATCGILYYENGVYYYEMFSTDDRTGILLDDTNFVEYPQIDNPESLNIGYNGTDVLYGQGISLYTSSTQPSLTIDLSQNNGDFQFYTKNGAAALYISDLYDYIGYGQRIQLNSTVDKELQTIIRKNSNIKYHDLTYRILSINTTSDVELNITAEAIRSAL